MVVLNLLLSMISQHHEGIAAAVVGSLPLIIAHIRALSSYEPVLSKDVENLAKLIRLCVGTHPSIHHRHHGPHN
jgi:hypothetical protein